MRTLLLAVLIGLGACVTAPESLDAQRVNDYIQVNELEQVDRIRLYRQLHYRYVNDYYVAVSVGQRHYLVDFGQPCRALKRQDFTASMVDHRYDPSYLRTADTIRGCTVDRIFATTEQGLVEVMDLADSTAASNIKPSN